MEGVLDDADELASRHRECPVDPQLRQGDEEDDVKLVVIAAANQHMGSLFTPQSFACGFAEGAALIVVPL